MQLRRFSSENIGTLRLFAFLILLPALSTCTAAPPAPRPRPSPESLVFFDFSRESMAHFVTSNNLGDWHSWPTVAVNSSPPWDMPPAWHEKAKLDPSIGINYLSARVRIVAIAGDTWVVFNDEKSRILVLAYALSGS